MIKDALAVINELQSARVIDRYAIGGAVGATFYLEPVATLDIDILVSVRTERGRVLSSKEPIHEYLTTRGARAEGEYLVIADWPVQFLPAAGSLLEEALAEAQEINVDGVPARAFTAEHLAAIALQTGRANGKARLLQFIEAGVLDDDRFTGVLTRHGLLERWKTFQEQFRGDPSSAESGRVADSKRALRQRLAARPFDEKLRLLDALRETPACASSRPAPAPR